MSSPSSDHDGHDGGRTRPKPVKRGAQPGCVPGSSGARAPAAFKPVEGIGRLKHLHFDPVTGRKRPRDA